MSTDIPTPEMQDGVEHGDWGKTAIDEGKKRFGDPDPFDRNFNAERFGNSAQLLGWMSCVEWVLPQTAALRARVDELERLTGIQECVIKGNESSEKELTELMLHLRADVELLKTEVKELRLELDNAAKLLNQ